MSSCESDLLGPLGKASSSTITAEKSVRLTGGHVAPLPPQQAARVARVGDLLLSQKLHETRMRILASKAHADAQTFYLAISTIHLAWIVNDVGRRHFTCLLTIEVVGVTVVITELFNAEERRAPRRLNSLRSSLLRVVN